MPEKQRETDLESLIPTTQSQVILIQARIKWQATAHDDGSNVGLSQVEDVMWSI